MSGGTVVVGSGASGVQFALTLLERGLPVTLVDVGHVRPEPVRPDLSLTGLKEGLDDPVSYFLGSGYEAVLFPGNADEYYGFPPNKDYVFRSVPQHRVRASGFAPLVSFAQGGLAEAWTGGSYPFNDGEMADWPFGYDALAPHYGAVARRIGISGETDDLARFMPVHAHLSAPLRLDDHSAFLLQSYERARGSLNGRLRAWMGRSRLATVRDDRPDGRRGCTYLGRCLWGCPTGSLWTPGLGLSECRTRQGFTYLPARFASHFAVDSRRRITHLVAEPPGGGAAEEVPVDRLVLAAGTLPSARIFLESVRRLDGKSPALAGLMDNRQILMPFVTTPLVGRAWNPDTYQYHQLALGLEGDTPRDYVHGLVTTLKTALAHPIVQNVPLDLRSALGVFKGAHAALGLVNINFHDTRRDGNRVSLEPGDADGRRLLIEYAPETGEKERLGAACDRMRRILRALGGIVPPGMTHVRPMGASVHYAGLLPMTASGAAPLTSDAGCRSHDFENLWLADGITFPFVPAKNLTFTLMANATRIAAGF